ncbi:hypothetical protein CHLRE_13g565950v5 [Chlamydomonas reinhardtii]|uniref:RING-type domain-containing protein n=1 Tax=Chlamydomonas reinhardtii TaxID=3055 RepID=A0A2K3CZB5_CHLRE|nr:uncharacterized protein CHLRE_13g565950v5 [Chlamydomonas reinhardtii]PNW73618.1 hypothetical protein CHLRE_13g565950v5 [Chlamydomonas reinhardtii]
MTLSLEAFDCAVCANLLLDPVVGPCGHDFCKECLESWRQAACSRGRRGNSSCPICRKPLPNELGVCLRLRETIQTLFPDKVKERRAEVEERRAAAAVAATAPAATSTIRRQASGAPGVHRSNIPWSGSSSFGAGPSASAGASTPLGAPFGLAWYNGAMPAAGGLAAATQAAVTAAAAAAAHTHAAPAPAPAVDTWTYSGALCFSLGWHDPNENRGRRSWGRRRRAVAV